MVVGQDVGWNAQTFLLAIVPLGPLLSLCLRYGIKGCRIKPTSQTLRYMHDR